MIKYILYGAIFIGAVTLTLKMLAMNTMLRSETLGIGAPKWAVKVLEYSPFIADVLFVIAISTFVALLYSA